MARPRLKLLPLIIVVALLGAGAYYAKIKFIDPPPGPGLGGSGGNKMGLSTPPPSVATPPPGVTEGAAPLPEETSDSNGGAVSQKFGFDNEANRKARADTLRRIEAMPHLTPAQKSKLTTSVDRAKSMGCVFIIPFENGKRELSSSSQDLLVKGFQTPSIKKLLEDPTLVFVILGYSDKQGSAAETETAANKRATNVQDIMKDKCGVQNVLYAVGMGAAQMLDPKSAAKNRFVEVWAVYP